jgi:hypothetical protein
MPDNFLDILLEAKGDKAPAKMKIKIDLKKDATTTDYDDDAPEEDVAPDTTPDAAAEDDNNADSQDYTTEDAEVDPADNANADGAPEEDANAEEDTTDYGDGAEGGDSTDEEGGDTTDTENTEEDPAEVAEKIDNRRLLSDYTNFYYMNKGVIDKLSSVNRSDLLINKIINQVKINLTELQKQVYDYIVYQFSNGKYVQNLYNYNYFIEAFRINVQMLKKISVLSSNE